MAKYNITSPSGERFVVTAPDSATNDEILAYAKSQWEMSSKQQPEQKSGYEQAASEMGVGQRLLAGLGSGFQQLGTGLKQRNQPADVRLSPSRIGPAMWRQMHGQPEPQQQPIDKQTVLEQRKAVEALGPAGTVGNITAQALALAPASFIPGANTLAGSMLMGSAIGGMQPTAHYENPMWNAAFGAAGGAAGYGIGSGIGRLLTGKKPSVTATSTGGKATSEASASGELNAKVTGGGSVFGDVGEDVSAGLTEAQKRILKEGKQLGMRVTPGQAAGSRSLQQMEAKLESQPMTSGPFNAIKDRDQKILNRTVAHSIGEKSDIVDDSVLSAAHDRLQGVFKLAADERPRTIEPNDFLDRLSSIESNYEGMLPQGIADNPLVKRLLIFATDGQATGKQLQTLTSKLGNAAHQQMISQSGDRALGLALFDVKEMVDDYLMSGMTGETLKKFMDARSQWRNLKLLTNGATGIVNPSTGNINGISLARKLQGKDVHGFTYGENQTPMYQAARFYQAFKPVTGDSGTATRSMVLQPTDFALSLPFRAAAKAYTSAPVTNLAAEIGGGLFPSMDQSVADILARTGGLMGAASSPLIFPK